jgi:hypothetical protein
MCWSGPAEEALEALLALIREGTEFAAEARGLLARLPQPDQGQGQDRSAGQDPAEQ